MSITYILFKTMSSDMHLREPGDLWAKYMEPEWRDQAPKILSSPTRNSAMILLDGKILRGYNPRIAAVYSMLRGSTRKSRARELEASMPLLIIACWGD